METPVLNGVPFRNVHYDGMFRKRLNLKVSKKGLSHVTKTIEVSLLKGEPKFWLYEEPLVIHCATSRLLAAYQVTAQSLTNKKVKGPVKRTLYETCPS